MRRCAEAEKSHPLAFLHAGNAQRAKTDDAGAKQRRGVQVIEAGRQRMDEIGARDGELGVAAVDRVAGEVWRVAEIFLAAAAVGAGAVDPAHPGDADARAERQIARGASQNFADDLVAGNDFVAYRGQLALDDVEVGAADAADADFEQYLARFRLGLRDILDRQRALGDFFRRVEDGGFHEGLSAREEQGASGAQPHETLPRTACAGYRVTGFALGGTGTTVLVGAALVGGELTSAWKRGSLLRPPKRGSTFAAMGTLVGSSAMAGAEIFQRIVVLVLHGMQRGELEEQLRGPCGRPASARR